MIYNRSFDIQAAHFNTEEAYQIYWELLDRDTGTVPSITQILKMVDSIHGHNFVIEVEISGELGVDSVWLVDDVALEKHVMRWNNKNLSTHPDFVKERLRATTEKMADIMRRDLSKMVGDSNYVTVTVHETDKIFAVSADGDD